ncbi:LysR family transcriptional regulator [Gordonia sp. CPCC 206044]|uniref:LysR family transcriptional regulator n=1 Tax=Gordonia sp. CPCC 206044 TaxID=3140793 RepID=UPI003AF38DA6
MTTLDITPLRSFDAVVAFSSVAKAAEVLHLSRPAVTGHRRKLERELGCALVAPQGRGITLTSDGEELAARARLLLDQHDETVRALLPPQDDEIVVAATEHAAESLVPIVVSALDSLVPQRRVRLRLTRSVRARDLIAHDRADVALMLTSATAGSSRVATLPLEWIGADGAPTDRLVLFSTPCAVRHRALATLHDRRYTIARECSDLTTVLTSVRRGLGVTPLPRFGPLPDGLRRVPTLPQIADVPFYLATSPRVPQPVRNALIQLTATHLGSA